MQTVTFAKAYSHVTPQTTTDFEADFTGSVSNDIAEAAESAGALKEKAGGSDKGSTKGDTGGAKS